MKKKMIILPAVLVILLTVVLVLKNTAPDTGDDGLQNPPSYKTYPIFTVTDDDITSFKILGGRYDYAFAKDKSGEWEVVKPEFQISVSAMSSLLYQIENIYIKREVAGEGYNSSEYGLDRPTTLRIKMSDGSQQEFYYGDKAPNDEGYYLVQKGVDKVYLIETNKADIVLNDFKGMIDGVLFDIGENGLTGLRVKKNGKLLFDIDEGPKQTWDVIKPIKIRVQTAIVEMVVPLLSKIEVKEFIAIGVKNFSEYGLDSPFYDIQIRSRDNRKFNILLGDETGDGSRYAMKKGDDKVFAVNPIDLPFLDTTLDEIMEPFVYLQDIYKVKKLEVDYAGFTDYADIDVEIKEKENIERYYYEGSDVSYLMNDKAELLFKNYYSSLVGIKWYEYNKNISPAYKKPELTITYSDTDDVVTKIEYIKKNSIFLYVFKNGEFTGLLVEKGELDGIKPARKILRNEVKRRGEELGTS